MDLKSLRYATSHEWARLDGDTCTVGITKFAVEQLTDVVYLALPDVGKQVTAGQSFGEIESVKAVSDLYAPVSGEITAVNKDVLNNPSAITADPYDKGWLVKIKATPGTSLGTLLTLEQYDKQIAAEQH
jgi:glycine cleavage system H protein